MNLSDLIYRICHWETWDWRLKYIPLIPSWIWCCIRAGSFWFFTPSNPGLTFGGFDGVSKREAYDRLPQHTFPKSIFITHGTHIEEVEKQFEANHFKFPVVVKPEIGRMGLMFRKIESMDALRRYHEIMPVNYILQDYISYPHEVSVFYYRFPDEPSGHITGFIRKEYLVVTGDGISTLEKLINDYPRVRFRLEEMKEKHKEKLNEIIPNGHTYYLSNALNLSRGGKLVNLEHEKDDRLLKLFDGLSHHTKDLFYGRYDIKCASVEDLKEGKNFCILEYNGSGGEPHHVYGNGNTLFGACFILAQHWNALYKISKQNYLKGIHYWDMKRGWKFFREANKHVQLLKKLDVKFPD
jgi:hypothetical protein